MGEISSYEHLRDKIADLKPAANEGERRLEWVSNDRALVISRDTVGRLEVFVEGEPLTAGLKQVAEVVEYQSWRTDDDSEFSATRILLPPGDHFDRFGALLCVELLDHGVRTDAQGAFTAVEPLIALALMRASVSDQTLIGLIGEIAFLHRLLTAATPAQSRSIFSSWAGSAPSARDFQLGSVGVEVKTTQGSVSTHHVQGVHQVEVGSSNQGVIETDLFMLSLGIGWVSEEESGTSLPELVDAVLSHLDDEPDRAAFLARIKQYGGDAAVGYDHEQDQNRPRYSNRFYFRFERLYDMTDERIKVLTSARLAGLSNVDARSVAFRVNLKDRIRGVHNPIVGWRAVTRKILDAAGLN